MSIDNFTLELFISYNQTKDYAAQNSVIMAGKAPYKTTFEPEHTIQPIYTGGSVALDQTGRILATTLGEDALITDLNSGRELARIEGVSEISMPVFGSFC